MLGILGICQCLFFLDGSILNKITILGQPPRGGKQNLKKLRAFSREPAIDILAQPFWLYKIAGVDKDDRCSSKESSRNKNCYPCKEKILFS